ncbi:microcystin degradation protein MlrC [Haladaptatus sp. W1]|uniref:M81 family metallopeptidase n=1 Tax=Haladaptatus sp. W1 TaxID=1897478 RepID=UPI000849ABDF|nr:M81 family metallopeptidase [Haladaptatus sp. W1]ODR80244.1 microcystin degradation protein MlrC [Haladaptatus sp. W1]
MSDELVLVGDFSHETNTFATTPTNRPKFQERREYFGEQVDRKLRETNTAVGGVIDIAEDEQIELVHTVAASATPGGIIPQETYDFYCNQILAGIKKHRDALDGVLLCLHGAMVPEGMEDGEGPLVEKVREIVGDGVPIVVTLDLHGNITDQLVEEADALVAYESYPHIDMGDTGRRGMRILTETMRGETDPTMHIERPPVLAMGPLQNTLEGPMAEVMAKAREYEERDEIQKVNVFPGFHQADIPSMGFSIPVVADGDPDAAKAVARELAEYIWARREEFVGDFPTPSEAVAEAQRAATALDAEDGPIVMADVGDNPGGGGAADGTTVLREMIDQELTNAGFAIMHDPGVVAECANAGVGERVTVTMGGKTDDLHGEPIEDIDGYVKVITDGEFVNTGPMGTGSENHLGTAVHLKCGHEDGVSVIVTDNRLQPLDAEIWRHIGIQPERLDVLVVKSTNHYRADYESMASRVIPINSIGLVAMDPRKFDFSHIQRPQFPLDDMDDDAYPPWERSIEH